MSTKKKEKHSSLSIIEAVETLSNIVDLNVESALEFPIESEETLNEFQKSHRIIELMTTGDTSETIDMVKEVFLVVLQYLKNFYRYEYQGRVDTHTVEGIKNIMVLVGEAAKKVDRFTALFVEKNPQSVLESKEYKDLQKFYQSRVSRKVDQGQLGKWILGLAGFGGGAVALSQAPLEELKTKYVFMDLETVKKDLEYELFYIRKEDGSRFFNPRLIRNMKLVSDFGTFFGEVKEKDPLIDLIYWKDRCAQISAINILHSLGGRTQKFFLETARFRKGELAGILNSAMMALLLCSHEKHLLKNNSAKCCLDYYYDFQEFFWEALQSREYQKMIVYPPSSGNSLGNCLLETMRALAKGIFLSLKGDWEMLGALKELFDREEKKGGKTKENCSFEKFLESDYAFLSDKLKIHANGPLILLLNNLESGSCQSFHPLKDHNLPTQICSFHFQDNKVLNIRMPSPTVQEYAHKAHIDELFNDFIRYYQSEKIAKTHLIVNLQDRTSWRENARCQALENLSKGAASDSRLCVITLATDTDFYHQLPPYQDNNDADTFKEQFIEHLGDESAGFYFPEELRAALFPDFIDRLVDMVHKVFFAERKVLTQNERMNFITIVYNLVILKVVEIIRPDSMGLVCKDGIDLSCSFNAMLIVFCKLVNDEPLNQNDRDCLRYLIYIPSLSIRERLMVEERFDRFISMVKFLEKLQVHDGGAKLAQAFHEACSQIYQTQVFRTQVVS